MIRPHRLASFARRATACAAALVLASAATIPLAPSASAQVTPEIERRVPFDSSGRLTLITPTIATRLELAAPEWPVSVAFREARLVQGSAGQYVLIVELPDRSSLRYPLSTTAFDALRGRIERALDDQVQRNDRGDMSGMEVSEPAGNTFVRNQTILGLLAYGPATSALLSDAGGGIAAASYFLAAGSSFFVAANLVKHRTVTRAQASLASHGGTRGVVAGAAIAAIADANGGPAYGAAILTGALGGTIAGFQGARGMSDGEAGASGLGADMFALTTAGLAGALGAFDFGTTTVIDDFTGEPFEQEKDDLRSSGKIALGAAIGSGLIGYVLGPRYAQRAAYNVTSGDAKIAFTGALLGAVAATTSLERSPDEKTVFAVGTGGLLVGFALADRLLVRTHDRTGAEGTLVQIGAFAGALIGGGVAAGAEAGQRATLAMITGGGALGMLAADRIVEPAPDAGPLRGIMPSPQNSASASATSDSRVTVSLTPLLGALATQTLSTGRTVDGVPHLPLTGRPVSRRLPVVRIAW